MGRARRLSKSYASDGSPLSSSHGVTTKCHSAKNKCHSAESKCHSAESKCHSAENKCHSAKNKCHSATNKCHQVAGARSGVGGSQDNVALEKNRKIFRSTAWFVTTVCYILATAISPTLSVDYSGTCVLEDLTSPVWTLALVGENQTMLPWTCGSRCGSLHQGLAAVEEATYCFCSDNETRVSQLAKGTCSWTCGDGSLCGGDVGQGLDVYTTVVPVVPQISISEPDIAGKVATVTVNSTGWYYTDWGDGAISVLGFTSHEYTQSGRFVISAVLYEDPGVFATTTVTIIDEPTELELDCPIAIEVGVPTPCNTSATLGYNFTFSGHIASEFQNLTFHGNIPDPEIDIYGSALHPENATGLTFETLDGSQIIILRGGPVRRSGVLVKVWVWASTPFEMDIVELTPECATGTFCAEACRTECPGTCAVFCVASGTCASTTEACKYQGTPSKYSVNVIASVSGAGSTAGEAIRLATPAPVTEGTKLGCMFTVASDLVAVEAIEEGTEQLKDMVLDATGSAMNLSNHNHAVRLVVEPYPPVALLPPLNCSTPSPTPVVDVPTPYSADTEAYINDGSFVVSVEVSSEELGVSVQNTSTPLCQVAIGNVSVVPEIWKGYAEAMNYSINITRGSPIFATMTIDTTPVYHYHDNAETNTFSWAPALNYALEGVYLLEGYAKNYLGNVTFSSVVHVVPEVTDTWVMTITCPCYNIEPFFTVNLTFPSAEHPPWNASVHLSYSATTADAQQLTGVLADVLEDFGTVGASGSAAELKIGYGITPTIAGNYTVTANLSNEVSSTSLSENIIVLEGIRNVSALITWVLDGKENNGTGPNNDIYITNLTTLVRPITATGTPDKWRLQMTPPGTVEVAAYAPDFLFNFTYTESGPVTFIIGAYNEIQGWVDSEPINVTYVSEIEGFTLTDDGVLGKINVPKAVNSIIEVLPPMSCLYVDWGDWTNNTYGDKDSCLQKYPKIPYNGPLTSDQILYHSYKKEGEFIVTGFASDKSGKVLDASLQVVVADVPCKMPSASIVLAVTKFYSAPKQIKSLPVRVETKTVIECNRTVPVKRFWRVMKVNKTTGQDYREVMIENKLKSWNYSTFVVDALFLDIGIYKFIYTVEILASKIVSLKRSVFTYQEIIRSNLSAAVIAGSITSLRRGYEQSLDLTPGTASVDPDEPGVSLTNVTWFCRQLAPSQETLARDSENFPTPTSTQPIPAPKSAVGRTGGGCFGVGPGMLEFTGSQLNFKISSFYLSEAKYEFTVVVRKDVRRAKASLAVDVTPVPPPGVNVKCTTPSLCLERSDGKLVNPSLRLSVAGNCTDYCTDTRYYLWEVMNLDESAVQERQPGCDPEFQTCEEAFLNDLNTDVLIISPKFFELNEPLEAFLVKFSVITSDERVGFSQITIRKNLPPTGGTCSMSEGENFCLTSEFEIVCEKWTDPEAMGISMYNFYYLEYKSDGSVTKAAMATTSHSALSARLPFGHFGMFVSVSDSFGAQTDYFIKNVTTLMPSEEDVNAFNITTKLAELASAGDTVQLSMFITAMNSFMSNADWLDLSDEAFQNMSLAAQDLLLKNIADTKAQQLDSIKNSAPPSTIDEVNVYTGALRSSVSSILDNSASSLTVGMDAREDGLTSLETITNSLPGIDVGSAQQLETYVRDSLGIMTALMEGINSVLDTTERLPPRDLKAAMGGQIDYDGTAPNDPNAMVPDTMEGIYKQSVLESTKKQSMEQISRMKKIVETMNNEVMKKLTKGEVLATRDDSGASAYMTKIGEETLKNGKKIVSPIDGNSSIELPNNFCPSKFIDEFSNCREVFGLMFLTWPVLTHYYPDSRQYLTKFSKIVELVVTSKEKEVHVKDSEKLIYLNIPRDPEKIVDPVFVNTSTAINSVIPLVYHYFNITAPDSGYVINVKPSSFTERLVLTIGHEIYPVPGRCLFSYIINELPLVEDDVKTLFINSEKNQNLTGRFVAGIGKLLNDAHPSNFTRQDLDPEFSSNYEFQITVVGCYFFNESSIEWSGSGLRVVKSNATHTTCTTDHLSQFGSGFMPTVNKIDFDFLIANMGFVDNSTLYATLILLFVTLIIMLIWGHYKDRKDVERRGVIPLPDNNPQDKYVYEVTFFTGPDSDSPCESKIFFVASGDFDETGIRRLPKANRNLYRRYDRNTFVMTTPKPLGPLHYLRVFHDNSGRLPYDSWQLERVVFRDLQQAKQFTFETNAWLALNREDGRVDRTFMCADNNEDLRTFTNKMYTHTNKGVNQDHIWMSVFLRPIGSRFCRKERVAVCATFLFVSMLFNAMFYEIEEESGVDPLIKIGPIPIATSQILTGLMSILVVFPLITLLGVVFKRARPRKNIRCLALDAIEKQRKNQFLENGMNEERASEKCKVREVKGTKPRPKVEPVVKCLPWWTRVIGWIICAVAILGSSFFVWSYGITWGEITTVKWFCSFFTSFVLSILVAQWLKVLFSSCLSSVCFSTNLAVEDIDCDEELPHLEEDEEWAFMTPLDSSAVRNVHRVTGVTHNVTETARLSKKLTKDRDMKFIVRGILIYVLFLSALLVIVNDKTDYAQFLMQRHLTNTFIRNKYEEADVSEEVHTKDKFWLWTKKVLMNEVRVQRWYNNDVPYGLRGFLNDKENRIVGYPIIRQVRNGRFQCKVVYPMNNTVPECTGTRGLSIEDDQSYCAAWVLVGSPISCNYEEFRYETQDNLHTYTTIGRLGTYGPGGYVIRLRDSQEDVVNRLTELQHFQWIDKRTRGIFVEFSVYNANANLFALCVILFEVNEGGGLIAKWSFQPVRLLRLSTSFKDLFTYFCEIFFLIGTVFFTLRQLWELKKQKCGYFTKYWNLAEMSIVIASWVEVGLYFYKMLLTKQVLEEFERTKGNEYVRMDEPVLVEHYYLYVLAFIMFFSLLKLIKLLQFNKRMDVLALTISLCWDELAYFFIAFAVIFFAFCCLFYFMFILHLPEFASLMSAVQTSFSMMLGKFEFEAMKQANSLSPLLFFVFSVTNSMILVNIMLAIILKAFNEVKIDLEKKENPYDVMDYMWYRFKKLIVLQPEHISQVQVDGRMKAYEEGGKANNGDLPEKVSQLLQYVNVTYFDGQLDMRNSTAMKAALGLNPERQKRTVLFPEETPRRVYCSD